MKTDIRRITPTYVKGLTYEELVAIDDELKARMYEIEAEAKAKVERIAKARIIVNNEAFDKAVEGVDD